MAAYRTSGGVIVVAVRLTPKADRDAITGSATLADGREVMQARVRSLPVEGAANAALVALLAKALRVPKSAITILAGETQRVKQVRIDGEATSIGVRLDAILNS